MRTLSVLLILTASALASPACAEVSFVETTCPFPSSVALRIVGANGERAGVAAEYAWLRSNRPGWKVIRQSVGLDQGKVFDRMLIVKGGNEQTLCFDISDFFGKY